MLVLIDSLEIIYFYYKLLYVYVYKIGCILENFLFLFKVINLLGKL